MAAPSLQAPSRRSAGVVRRRGLVRTRPANWEDEGTTAVTTVAEAQIKAVPERLSVTEGLGIALSLFAVLLAAFAAYLFGWSNLQAARDQRRLLASYSATGEFQAFHGRTPPDGSLVAVLQIPAIGLHQAVVEGTTSTDLKSGPGLMPRTAVPGSRGESVIAGRHGTFGSPFARLSQLRAGDRILVVDFKGSYVYVVSSVRTLGSGKAFASTPSQGRFSHLSLLSPLSPRGIGCGHRPPH